MYLAVIKYVSCHDLIYFSFPLENTFFFWFVVVGGTVNISINRWINSDFMRTCPTYSLGTFFASSCKHVLEKCIHEWHYWMNKSATRSIIHALLIKFTIILRDPTYSIYIIFFYLCCKMPHILVQSHNRIQFTFTQFYIIYYIYWYLYWSFCRARDKVTTHLLP